MSKEIVRYDPDQRLSDMVEYDGRLYLAGQVGEDTKADAKGQTTSILRQIDKLLARGGSGSRLSDLALLEQAYRDEGYPDEHDHRGGAGCRAVSDQREDDAADEDGRDRSQARKPRVPPCRNAAEGKREDDRRGQRGGPGDAGLDLVRV